MLSTVLEKARTSLRGTLHRPDPSTPEASSPLSDLFSVSSTTSLPIALQKARAHNASRRTCPLACLPTELVELIASFLEPLELASLAITCCPMYVDLRSALAVAKPFQPPDTRDMIRAIINRPKLCSPYRFLKYLENETWKYCLLCYTLHPRSEFAVINEKKVKKAEKLRAMDHREAGGPEPWFRFGPTAEKDQGQLKPYCTTPGLVNICPGWSLTYRQARRLKHEVQALEGARRSALGGVDLKGKKGNKTKTRLTMEDFIPWKELVGSYRILKTSGVATWADVTMKVSVGFHRGDLCVAVRYYPPSYPQGTPTIWSNPLPGCKRYENGICVEGNWVMSLEKRRKIPDSYLYFKEYDPASVHEEGEEWIDLFKILGKIRQKPDRKWM